MNKITVLQKVSEETMRFMRGSYVLDEVCDGKDELKFRFSGRTVLTIYIRDDRYDFLVIFGKAERDKFDTQRGQFPQIIQDIYDTSKTYHDGKWMFIPVADLETLEAVKQLIFIKKKPNRKPFPKESAVYSRCGMRCDYCVHYTEIKRTPEFQEKLNECVSKVYDCDPTKIQCAGCGTKETDKDCDILKCLKTRGLNDCRICNSYPCNIAPPIKCKIEAKNISADDVTYGILPYVTEQYVN